MDRTPLLSIIIPVYKVEKYLNECVDSVLAQTFQDYEIILVDDGSPDNCGRMCDGYRQSHPDRIKVVHKPNGGLSSARNAGIAVASGKYIGFVDSDDCIVPEMYERMIDAMTATGADIVFSQILNWDGTPRKKEERDKPQVCTGKEALQRIFGWKENVSAWSKLFSRSIIGDTRFIEGRINEDFPFISELALRADTICILPEGFYRYRVTPGSITQVLRPNFFDIFANLDTVRGLLPVDDSELQKAFRRYSMTMHVMSGVKIVRNRKNGEFKEWLALNRRYIRQNAGLLFADPELSMRWRLKALFTFLRLP